MYCNMKVCTCLSFIHDISLMNTWYIVDDHDSPRDTLLNYYYYTFKIKVFVERWKMHVSLWKFFCALTGVFFTICATFVMIRLSVFEFYAKRQIPCMTLNGLSRNSPGYSNNQRKSDVEGWKIDVSLWKWIYALPGLLGTMCVSFVKIRWLVLEF